MSSQSRTVTALTMNKLQRHKIAFYPCCARDFLEPLEILSTYVDEVVFCDLNRSLQAELSDLMALKPGHFPSVRSISDNARRGVQTLERIDVLFYRRDSMGEGGSRVLVLAKPFILTVLEKMPPEGGLIITDGSNRGNHYYRKTFRPQGVKKFGYHMYALPTSEQPFKEKGLHVISVTRL